MEYEKCCGTVILNKGKVLLIKDNYGNWGVPKGHVEENETEVETALRETKEETNLDVKVDKNTRYVVEYNISENVFKTVVYFVASLVGGKLKPQDGEVEEIQWLDFNDAIERVTFDNIKELLKKIMMDT